MKIGFNGLFLDNTSVGIGKYTMELLRSLRGLELSVKVYVTDIKHSELIELEGSSSIEFEAITPPTTVTNEFLRSRLWELMMFWKAKREDFDVFHSPYFVCSPFKIKNEIATIHDIIHVKYPEYVTSWPRRMYWWYNHRLATRLAHIVTDSNWSRNDILQCLNVNSRAISVVYPGVSDRFRHLKDRSRMEGVIRKYDLPKRFILYLGGYDKRKNVEFLLKTFQWVITKHPSWDYNLVLGGKRPEPLRGLVADFDKLIQDLSLSARVRFTGYIDEVDLPTLYSLAEVFVYPSLYEGFGLPVLEAMACGIPTLASNASSIPEIVSRGDLLFEPLDQDAFASKMLRLTTDATFRQSTVEWSVKRAERFTWQGSSTSLLSVYKSLVCECT